MNDAMKRKLGWFIPCGIMMGCLLLDVFITADRSQYVKGLSTLGIVMTWLTIIQTLYYNVPIVKAHIKKEGRPVPRWLDLTYDVSIILILFLGNHEILGTLYLVHATIHDHSIQAILKEPEVA